ncbi:MAG: TIGR03618 family F420-dependent PPOX class oxidoreductase [Actinomycetota bacterium]|nr:TIGR03618 family F420-dependent PPOX class oxidoreductase [Actinomycetota bacterium]
MASSFDPRNAPTAVLGFLAERHLATLTTIDPSGDLQVTPVGTTFDPQHGLVRVITWATAQKARNVSALPGQRVAVCQVDGGRWLALHGPAIVSADPEAVAEGVRRYAERYRPSRDRPDRVVIEITVDRIVGRV